MLLLSLFASPAVAFCGTFVSVGDDAPTNEGSQIAIVRQNGMTTLTMANDVHGSLADFAMVIPIPEILAETALHVVDPAIMDHIAGYSGARLVSYQCSDFEQREDEADSDTDVDYDYGDTGDTDTTVEAQYIVGEYDIVILSSVESGSLVGWLQDNGYNVPSESQSLLGEYIDSGSYFLAAQVREDAGLADGATLSPLQLTYTDAAGTLPIRLGTLNSTGQQDLTIFGITDVDAGALAISNYPEAEVETDCMLPEGVALGDHVDGVLDAALPLTGEAQWVTEYAFQNGSCDPCSPDGSVSAEDLESLGFDPDYHYGYTYMFTRLHLRYAPEQITQDLVLYESGLTEQRQLRYIEYNLQMEDRFETCGLGMVDAPGSCEDDDGEPWGAGDTDERALAGTGCGCESAGAPAAGLILLAAAMARRRRDAV